MPNPKGNLATLEHYKPKWKSGKTRTIRVPVTLADQLLDYAHKLDDGSLTQVNPDSKTDSPAIAPQANNLNETLSQVLQVLEEVCETPHTSKFTKVLKARIQTEVTERLKQLTQVNSEV